MADNTNELKENEFEGVAGGFVRPIIANGKYMARCKTCGDLMPCWNNHNTALGYLGKNRMKYSNHENYIICK